ncbi:uncharacterized protein ACJ7VT_006265 isoform 2-T2 [Polymixia lowei]
MIGRLVAMTLLSTVSLIQTAEVPHLISLTTAELGDTVTLRCPVLNPDSELFHWHKQSLGYMPQTVGSIVYKKETLHENSTSRFKLEKGVEFTLTIRNVTKEDEATYICEEGSMYTKNSMKGTFLSIKEYNEQKFVDQTLSQSPVSESVHLGDSVKFHCSVLSKRKEHSIQCPGEHSVYWFRAGSGQFHPGVIYTHWNRRDECEKSPGTPSAPQSCVYSLSKNNVSSSDAGTYYCAVTMCGEIMLGNGTRLDIRTESHLVVMVLGTLLACCVIVILILIYTRNPRRICKHCKETLSASYHVGHDKSTMDQSSDLDGEAVALDYAALDFSVRKAKREKKRRESPQDSVYSAARTDWE